MNAIVTSSPCFLLPGVRRGFPDKDQRSTHLSLEALTDAVKVAGPPGSGYGFDYREMSRAAVGTHQLQPMSGERGLIDHESLSGYGSGYRSQQDEEPRHPDYGRLR